MNPVLAPLFVAASMIAGWLERRQQLVIEYLIEENRTLKQQLGKRRLRLNDHQRRRLAVKGKKLGRKVLTEVATLVTPDTILGIGDSSRRSRARPNQRRIAGALSGRRGQRAWPRS